MQIRIRQLLTAVLAATAAYAGGWAFFAPRSFYTTFPLPGRHWVSMLGAYNEHLVRDVGAFYLALLAISVWTVLLPRRESFVLTGLAWEVFSVPHLIYHLGHLEMFDVPDRVGLLVALGGTVVLAAPLLVPLRRVEAS